ncbi:hypothetical protein ZEAMMB73_Zm00001d020761 [Zea mays]|uniref:Uncharacterized protein n=1 Tax=Zea mays TaxID=4577 RepID=A0A1D6I622_MAIZE|nr:hypothetical protein ZEAMMB73_Zm00001d020761 [Zea mays]
MASTTAACTRIGGSYGDAAAQGEQRGSSRGSRRISGRPSGRTRRQRRRKRSGREDMRCAARCGQGGGMDGVEARWVTRCRTALLCANRSWHLWLWRASDAMASVTAACTRTGGSLSAAANTEHTPEWRSLCRLSSSRQRRPSAAAAASCLSSVPSLISLTRTATSSSFTGTNWIGSNESFDGDKISGTTLNFCSDNLSYDVGAVSEQTQRGFLSVRFDVLQDKYRMVDWPFMFTRSNV